MTNYNFVQRGFPKYTMSYIFAILPLKSDQKCDYEQTEGPDVTFYTNYFILPENKFVNSLQ